MNDFSDSPDEFDRFARAAGEALRRPAPADGAAGIRGIRRRQQIVRGVAGVGAVALIVGIGAVAMSRSRGDERVATDTETTLPAITETTMPEKTMPGTTMPGTTMPGTTVPETTVPETTVGPTTAPPVVAPGTSLVAWGDAQRAAGRTDVARSPVEGGEGALYVSRRGSEDVAAALMLGDGRVTEVPSEFLPGPFQDLHSFQLGGRVAVVALSWGDDTPPSMAVLEPATLAWSKGPELGFGPASGTKQAWSVDGSVLVGQASWVEDGDTLAVGDDRHAVIVRPDLSVEDVATPPEGVQPSWTSVSGRFALAFGYADVGSAFVSPPYEQPWSFDVRTNAWSPVATPDWTPCEPECNWLQPTEGGTPFLEVGTDAGVVKLIPDGSVGVFDPDEGSWRRVDDPPVELTLPTTAVVDGLVVAAATSGGASSPEPGTFAVLDVANGSWLTGRVPLAEDDQFFWVVRTDADGVLLTRPSSSWPTAGIDDEHDVVVDADTPTGRLVTNDEAGRWVPLSPFFDLTIDELT